MMIRSKTLDMASPKELKVKLPLGQHIRLHSAKLLTGRHISDMITEALDAWFAAQPSSVDRAAARALEAEAALTLGFNEPSDA